MNLRYDHNFENNWTLKTNFDYIYNNNQIKSTLYPSNEVLNSKQKFNEFTFSPLILKRYTKGELTNSVVVTNRNFKYLNSNNNHNINQNLVTLYSNFLYRINTNNSFMVGLRYQYDYNNFTKENHYLLPNLTYYKKFDSIIEFDINYKRKIQRPSIISLSNTSIIDQNGNMMVYQSFVSPQIENIFTLNLYKTIKKTAINLSIEHQRIQDYIGDIYGFDLNNVNYTIQNIEHYSGTTVRGSTSFSLWKESRLNLNYSISDIHLKDNGLKNNGTVHNVNFSLSGPMFKNYLFSLNSFYTSKIFNINSYTVTKPDFSISISKNFLKDKLNVNLEMRNVLNQDTERKLIFEENEDYYHLENQNQSRLLLISLTYNFGKNFSTTRKNIQNTNSDIKP